MVHRLNQPMNLTTQPITLAFSHQSPQPPGSATGLGCYVGHHGHGIHCSSTQWPG